MIHQVFFLDSQIDQFLDKFDLKLDSFEMATFIDELYKLCILYAFDNCMDSAIREENQNLSKIFFEESESEK